jgi:PAS domain S-box-containing protein
VSESSPGDAPPDLAWRNAPRYQPDAPVLAALDQKLDILRNLDTPVWVFDVERCQCLWANAPALEVWGADSVTALQQRDIASTQSEATYALVNDYLRRVLAGEKITQWLTLDIQGRTRRFRHSYHALALADARQVLFVEAKPEPSAEEMLAFASDYTLTIGLYALDGQLISSNPAFRQLAAHHPMDQLNALLPPESGLTRWQRQLGEQALLRFETNLETGRGIGHFRGELRQVVTQGGETRALLTLDNLTEQRIKQTEQALQENRARTERLLDSAEVATVVQDFQSGAVKADRRWWAMLGYAKDALELTPASLLALIHPDDRPSLLRETARLMGGELAHWALEYRLSAADGSWRWVLDRSLVTRRGRDGAPLEIGGIHLDVHARKVAELALAGSELRHRAMLNALPDLMAALDLEGRIVDLHMSSPEDWGFPTERAIGRNLHDILPPEVARRLGPLQAEVVASGQMRQGEYVIEHPRLGQRHREFRMVPYGADRTLALVRDVTDRYEAEQQHQQTLKQLQQSQKMEALGQLTGGIAHDFNNILASVIGYTWLAQQHPLVVTEPKLNEYLKVIANGSERGRELVQKMLTFSRRSEPAAVAAIDPLPVVQEAFLLLKSVIPTTLDLQLALPPATPAVAVAAGELHQVLVNLVINSRDAMPEHGTITLSIAFGARPGHFCASCSQAVPSDALVFAVRDTGSGIPAAVRDRIFDPFFTTKAVGAGTGIGLSVVDGIVHRYGGHILVTSEPGAGTVIEIVLPVAAAPAIPSLGSAPSLARRSAGGTLMVVDDELWVGAFLREVLEEDGYTVEVFTQSKAALAALREAPTRYAAVVTDLTMHEMTGLELATAIHRGLPTLPVLLCTGAGDMPNRAALAAAGVQHVLPKPIPVDLLRSVLTELLLPPEAVA